MNQMIIIVFVLFILIISVVFYLSLNHNQERNKKGWYTYKSEHEGYPLHLRYPAKPDFDILQNKFPKLLIVTHTFEKVNSTGLPETDYNYSLMEFDQEIVSAIDSSLGITVLIETFGGKRNYYIYVSTDAPVDALKQRFSDKYPQHNLDWNIIDNHDWRFIRNYSNEYNFYNDQ